jgi:hypothetical protein
LKKKVKNKSNDRLGRDYQETMAPAAYKYRSKSKNFEELIMRDFTGV